MQKLLRYKIDLWLSTYRGILSRVTFLLLHSMKINKFITVKVNKLSSNISIFNILYFYEKCIKCLAQCWISIYK